MKWFSSYKLMNLVETASSSLSDGRSVQASFPFLTDSGFCGGPSQFCHVWKCSFDGPTADPVPCHIGVAVCSFQMTWVGFQAACSSFCPWITSCDRLWTYSPTLLYVSLCCIVSSCFLLPVETDSIVGYCLAVVTLLALLRLGQCFRPIPLMSLSSTCGIFSPLDIMLVPKHCRIFLFLTWCYGGCNTFPGS